MKSLQILASTASLGFALALVGLPAYSQDEAESDAEEEGGGYIEEVVVTGERGETNVLDRAMTVTGFNVELIEKLGMQNADDLEVLVPGLQKGNRSQGAGKNEDGHYDMRGVGNDRAVNFFQDTSVAFYVDGVYTDQSYSTDSMFDMERVEVARGPQGTTGGKAAIAGAISLWSRKPTDEWDMRMSAEITDISTQRLQAAFGGPIADSGFSYRLGLETYTGDGMIENVYDGAEARDAGEYDRLLVRPSLRWKNDRFDITARYSKQTDKGTPWASLPLGARDTVNEFLLDRNGNPAMWTDRLTGEQIPQTNPFYGADAAPSVANCSNINNDGTRDEFGIICDPDELQWKVAFNAPIRQDSFAENASLEAIFALTDNLDVTYKFGYHDVVNDNLNDGDQLPREGGGVCPPNHPKVLGGMLQAGQTSRYCALDGGGNGTFNDQRVNYIFTSEQTSHEVTLTSHYEGPFNFTVGVTTMEGDEPNNYRNLQFSSGTRGVPTNDWLYTDSSAACQAVIESLYGPGGSLSGGQNWLFRDVYTSAEGKARSAQHRTVFACPGDPGLVNYALSGAGNFHANLNGQRNAFWGSMERESIGVYFNGEYMLNETWTLFGGVRHDNDDKGITQQANGTAFGLSGVDFSPCNHTSTCEDAIAFVQVSVRDAEIFPGKAKKTWSDTTWNVGAQYRPNDDVMVYARLSTGYRPGGNKGSWSLTQPPYFFESEQVTNYEIGAKGLYFDRSVQLSSTVFYQDFDSYWVVAGRFKTDAEIEADPLGGVTTRSTNAIEGTTIAGVELEGAWRMTDRFSLRGFYNYLDTSIGPYLSIYPFGLPGIQPGWQFYEYTDVNGETQVHTYWGTGIEIEFDGKQLPNSPKHKTSLTLAYDVPIAADWGSLELLTIMNYRSKKYVEHGNVEAYAVSEYTRWDLRANWQSPDSSLKVTGYVQNALDQGALHMWSPREGIASPFGTIVEPREFGIQISWQNKND
ncbi:MAG: TonB-dependent receptor [Gammaproteobacteria bacterium]|nr:TonB-dependent receptor [Gammaproteobacteria bacterium]